MWLILTFMHMCDVTHSHGSFLYSCNAWHVSMHTCCVTLVTHCSVFECNSFIRVMMTHSYLIYMCDMTHSYLLRHSWYAPQRFRMQLVCKGDDDSFLSHSYVWHDLFIPAASLLVCTAACSSVTHSYVWHDVFISRIQTLIHTCDNDSFSSNSYCDMTHSYLLRHFWYALQRVRMWLNRMYDMTHSYVWQCLIHMCDMTHSYVWHDSFICVTWLIHTCCVTLGMRRSVFECDSFICVTWRIHITHSYVPSSVWQWLILILMQCVIQSGVES